MITRMVRRLREIMPIGRHPGWVAYDPELLPPRWQMAQEGAGNLEEWFRWAEEWSVLLRVYGRLHQNSSVMEIGCGQGRIAFALRFCLPMGSYHGFDISRVKINRLQSYFSPIYPSFTFSYADVRNTHYNPKGSLAPADFSFPARHHETDLIFAASIFTHMLPGNVAHYFKEAARVLRPGGLCVFSFFLLDYYDADRARPFGFASPDFAFDHAYGDYGSGFRIADPDDPERMTAFSLDSIRQFALDADLELASEPIAGLWSGAVSNPVGMQDILVLRPRQRPTGTI